MAPGTMRLRRALVRAALVLGMVLATTGLWLVFTYAPGREQALGLSAHPAITPTRWLHRAAGLALVPVAAALAATVLGRRPARALAPVIGLAVVLALVWTGYRLPWDQLVLSAERTAGRFRGMVTAAFDANVRAVRIDGAEVGRDALRGRLLVHVALLPAVLAVSAAATARGRRARRTATEDRPPR